MFSLLLLGGLLAVDAAAAARPVCNGENAGVMWPLEANFNPALVSKLSRDGQLWLCGRGHWRFRWEKAAVHVNQLLQERRSKDRRSHQSADGTEQHLPQQHHSANGGTTEP